MTINFYYILLTDSFWYKNPVIDFLWKIWWMANIIVIIHKVYIIRKLIVTDDLLLQFFADDANKVEVNAIIGMLTASPSEGEEGEEAAA